VPPRPDDPTPPPGEPTGAGPLWSPDVLTTDDGSPALWSPRFGQAFRSRHGAHSEARHVFLEGSGAAERLAAGRATRVLEVGLGAATNLACTAAAALAAGTPLFYRAWEPEPLPAEALRLAGLGALAPPTFVAALLAARDAWDALAPGDVRYWRHGTLELELIVAPIGRMLDAAFVASLERGLDAARGADQRATPECDARVDVVYLDPFSPEANPEPWSPAVLAALAERLAPGGTLVSYSVRGDVRRALVAAGLEVRKVAGPPGGKREVLLALRPAAPAAAPTWDAP
jgi:tRNA U34 5-methylaminomethyl-2-thiouridine-forming methyltransferase MnmC